MVEAQKTIRIINDQALLADIARNSTNTFMRREALMKLTGTPFEGQALFAEIAKNDSDTSMRHRALNALKDQAVLSEIAKNDDEDTLIRMRAVRKLKDKTLLMDIAKNYGSEEEIP